MKKSILLLGLLCFGFMLQAQLSPDQIVDRFFNSYEKGDTDQTLNELYALSPWVDADGEAVMNLKESFRNLKDLVGEYFGYERLLKKELGSSFELHIYLVKFNRQPLRFQFEFYKPSDTWVVHSFSYDDNLEDELEEAARREVYQH